MGIKVNVTLDAYQRGILPLIPIPNQEDAQKILTINNNGEYILSTLPISFDEMQKLKDKVNSIPTDAEANIINIIKVNDIPLNVINKTVNILKASNSTYGVVKGSMNKNTCSINSNGEIIINNIDVDKLIQTNRIILECN